MMKPVNMIAEVSALEELYTCIYRRFVINQLRHFSDIDKMA
jgi:hypothetical protein